jgi:putative tricarboxylic transport membrane protein
MVNVKAETTMKLRTKRVVLSVAVALTVPVAVVNAATTEGSGGPRTNLTILVPGSAGGGYDSLGRETQQALRANAISGNVQVVNVPGASGTVGLSTLVEMDDRDDAILVLGSAMVGGIEVTGSATDFDDVTPIASVTTDYPIMVLPEDSPYDDVGAFLDGWAVDPAHHPIGGGALGTVDHLLVIAMAESVGIDPADINYIAYSGGGEVIGAMLSGTVSAGVSGYGEMSDQIVTDRITGIGIAAPEPVEGIDLPTFAEQGVDVVVTNWRGFVAPPNITAAQLEDYEAIFAELLETDEWKDALERQQWTELNLTGDDYTTFIDEEVDKTRTLLEGVTE